MDTETAGTAETVQGTPLAESTDDAARALIENSEGAAAEAAGGDAAEAAEAAPKRKKRAKRPAAAEGTEEDDGRFFKPYKIKDIVFLAVITACTLVTGAVMPLLAQLPVFGIIQLGLGLQFSIFPVIGLMKVRKPGALFFQSVFISIFLVFMFPPMVLIILTGLISEVVTLLIFRSYRNDWACVLAGTLYMPLTLPLLFGYYNLFYTVTGEESSAVSSLLIGGSSGWAIFGMSVAVVAVCFVGAVLGMVISRELKKAGVLKK